MGFLPSHLRLLLRAHRKHSFRGPVCTLGNQETWATYRDLEALFRGAGVDYRPVTAPAGHTSKMFSEDPALREMARDFVHSRVYFQMLGIDDYKDIDAFDFDRPAVQHDMNLQLPADYLGSCGLVIDGGTAEHIFDVRQVLTNTAQLLRVGGHVIHMASIELDHGFYSFSPCLFYDFYAANGFSDFSCYIMQFDYRNILHEYRDTVPVFEYQYGMRMDDLLDAHRKPAVFFVARKDREQDGLVVPMQGIYARKASGTKSTLGRKPSLFENAVPKWLQKPLAPIRPLLARSRHLVQQVLEARNRTSKIEHI